VDCQRVECQDLYKEKHAIVNDINLTAVLMQS